jgi:hypothetical protein
MSWFGPKIVEKTGFPGDMSPEQTQCLQEMKEWMVKD